MNKIQAKAIPFVAVLGFISLWGLASLWADESPVLSTIVWILSPVAWMGGHFVPWGFHI